MSLSRRRKSIYLDLDSSNSDNWQQISDICIQAINKSKSQIDLLLESKDPASKPPTKTTDAQKVKLEIQLYNYLEKRIQNNYIRELIFREHIPSTPFEDLEILILVLRTLSNFVVASADEDRYGQVLKTIPSILSTMCLYLDSLTSLCNNCSNFVGFNSIHPISADSDDFNSQVTVKEAYIIIKGLFVFFFKFFFQNVELK
ncbi:hypothetical protein AYI70_g2555 [Smittium culicis]|uniref:Uncharacterized protein n=1 Tax=Smittium culicis TaxID=133412 RepID=A0A1R1Y7N1_9FUNG|nr:hypothetical protein AYI70_g2555 [Smittium culicis]